MKVVVLKAFQMVQSLCFLDCLFFTAEEKNGQKSAENWKKGCGLVLFLKYYQTSFHSNELSSNDAALCLLQLRFINFFFCCVFLDPQS